MELRIKFLKALNIRLSFGLESLSHREPQLGNKIIKVEFEYDILKVDHYKVIAKAL